MYFYLYIALVLLHRTKAMDIAFIPYYNHQQWADNANYLPLPTFKYENKIIT